MNCWMDDRIQVFQIIFQDILTFWDKSLYRPMYTEHKYHKHLGALLTDLTAITAANCIPPKSMNYYWCYQYESAILIHYITLVTAFTFFQLSLVRN